MKGAQQLKLNKAAKYISTIYVAKVVVKTKLDLTGGGRHAGAPHL